LLAYLCLPSTDFSHEGLSTEDFTEPEKITLSKEVVGHIGMKSYYIRKGLILLAGLQIDPGWDGYLVLGMYNASPRNITLDYQSSICTVDFFSLAVPASQPFVTGEEQKEGLIPKIDKDNLRTLETQTLSEMSESVRQLSTNVSTLTTVTYKVVIPVLLLILGSVVIPLAQVSRDSVVVHSTTFFWFYRFCLL
jgi:hypothetical protein